MNTIPTSLTEVQFEVYIRPCLSVAKRGYVSKIPLYKVFNYILYRLHTGCQWEELPIQPKGDDPQTKELSYHAVYHHYRKWSRDGSLERVFRTALYVFNSKVNWIPTT